MVMLYKARIQSVLEANFESLSQILKAYSPFTYLLSAETDKKVDDFNHAKHVLQEVTSEISKFEKVWHCFLQPLPSTDVVLLSPPDPRTDETSVTPNDAHIPRLIVLSDSASLHPSALLPVLVQARKDVEKRSLAEVNFNLLLLSSTAVKMKLSARSDELANRMRTHIGQSFIAKCNELCGRYQACNGRRVSWSRVCSLQRQTQRARLALSLLRGCNRSGDLLAIGDASKY